MPERPVRPGRWRVVLLGALGGVACALPSARRGFERDSFARRMGRALSGG